MSRLPSEGWRADSYRVPPAPIVSALAERDRIDLGNRQLTVLHLPGHSRDSIALFEERSGILFSGDALCDGGLIDSFPTSDVAAYAETMERLRKFDIASGHGGHGPSFDNARKTRLIDEYLAGKRCLVYAPSDCAIRT